MSTFSFGTITCTWTTTFGNGCTMNVKDSVVKSFTKEWEQIKADYSFKDWVLIANWNVQINSEGIFVNGKKIQ